MEHETRLLFGIFGLIVGIIGVIVTVKLYRKVKDIDQTRRDDQKEHFKKLILNNLQEVLDIYNNTTVLTARDSSDEEILEEKTEELHKYFRKKDDEIKSLARDTKFYASMLSVVDNPSLDVDDVIKKTKWLTDEFCILQYDLQRSKRHWMSLENKLRENKDFIETSLSSLNMP